MAVTTECSDSHCDPAATAISLPAERWTMLDLSQGVRIEVKNVLYLTDFSKSSQAVVPIVRGIANAFDANVYVLHVILPDS
jgi:hypothetical protein